MKISQQVISYELARKLQDLGVTVDTNFRYVNQSLCIELPCSPYYNEVSSGQMISSFPEDEIVMAYTSSELGEMLPTWFNGDYHLTTFRHSLGQWQLCYENERLSPRIYKGLVATADTEAEARAQMLIWLLEDKLIAIEKINKEVANGR